MGLIVLTEVGVDELHALQDVLEGIMPYTLETGAQYLRDIIVAPDEEMEGVANALIARLTESTATYRMSSPPPSGIAVPIETADGLHTFILLSASTVGGIDPSRPWSSELVSTLLEELLHAEVYALTWERRGYIQPTPAQLEDCTADFYAIAGKLLDEYIVNRWKSEILGTVPLIEHDGELVTGMLGTPDSVWEQLAETPLDLSRIARAAVPGMRDPDATWAELLQWASSDVFGPLAYDAGRRAAYETRDEILRRQGVRIAQIELVGSHIWPYWSGILAECDRAYETNFAEADAATDAIALAVREFLERIGAEITKRPEGCWVDFSERFFTW